MSIQSSQLLFESLQKLKLGSIKSQQTPAIKLGTIFVLDIPITNAFIGSVYEAAQAESSVWELEDRLENGDAYLGKLNDRFYTEHLHKFLFTSDLFDSEAEQQFLIWRVKPALLENYRGNQVYLTHTRTLGHYKITEEVLQKITHDFPECGMREKLTTLQNISFTKEKQFLRELQDLLKDDYKRVFANLLMYAMQNMVEICIEKIVFIPFQSGFGFLGVQLQTRNQNLDPDIHVGTAANFNYFGRSLTHPKKNRTFPIRRFFKKDQETISYEDTYLTNVFNWAYKTLTSQGPGNQTSLVKDTFQTLDIDKLAKRPPQHATCFSYVALACEEKGDWSQNQLVNDARDYLKQLTIFSEDSCVKPALLNAEERKQLGLHQAEVAEYQRDYGWHPHGHIAVVSTNDGNGFNGTRFPKIFLGSLYFKYLLARQFSLPQKTDSNVLENLYGILEQYRVSEAPIRQKYLLDCLNAFSSYTESGNPISISAARWSKLREGEPCLDEQVHPHHNVGGGSAPRGGVELKHLNDIQKEIVNELLIAYKQQSLDEHNFNGALQRGWKWNRPSLRAMIQNDNPAGEPNGNIDLGANDLTYAILDWQKDWNEKNEPSSANHIYTQISINPSHDYLWFNAPALLTGLEEILQDIDADIRTGFFVLFETIEASGQSVPLGLCVRVYCANGTMPYLHTDAFPKNDRFYFNRTFGQKDKWKDRFALIFENAGAAVMGYCCFEKGRHQTARKIKIFQKPVTTGSESYTVIEQPHKAYLHPGLISLFIPAKKTDSIWQTPEVPCWTVDPTADVQKIVDYLYH